MMEPKEIVTEAQRILRHEYSTLTILTQMMEGPLGESFVAAVDWVHRCKHQNGTVILSGVGKSALVARRIAATLTVAGVRARFLCPMDAVHGDIGTVRPRDMIIAVTRSGETPELLNFLQCAGGYSSIVITAAPQSTIARQCELALIHPGEEACAMGLVPTSSSTAAAALGDALALVLQRMDNQTAADFAALHSGGTLGKRLTLLVRDVMVPVDDVGYVLENKTLRDALALLGAKRGTLIVRSCLPGTKYVGVITTGDVARWYLAHAHLDSQVHVAVTRRPYVTHTRMLVADALDLMRQGGITAMPVLRAVEGGFEVEGMLHLHDALRAGVQ